MILTADLLSTFQRCSRRWVLEQSYEPIRQRPKDLLEKILRIAVFELSNGRDKKEVTKRAEIRFLEQCAKPGLATHHDPYVLAQDMRAIIETVLESISRITLLTLKPGLAVPFSRFEWQCQSFRDESGLLHRWVVVDRLNSDHLSRQLHSWQVFGDMAAARVPMCLHVVEIGQTANSHQQTPWCRAYKHPLIIGLFKFQNVDGSKLKGTWKPVYYQDSDRNAPETWVDMMEKDRVKLIHHLDVLEPSTAAIEDFERQVNIEVTRMNDAGKSWSNHPLYRNACDIPPCPWQPVCYRQPGFVDIEAIGGFQKIEN